MWIHNQDNSVILIDKGDYVWITKELLLPSLERSLTFTRSLGQID